MTLADKVEVRKGLKDVYFDRSDTCFIDGKAGKLLFRGYNIHDLAEYSTFEETSYLLLHGSLPRRAVLDAFVADLKAERNLPDGILRIIEITKSAHPMDVLRTAVSAMSTFDDEVSDTSPESVLRKAVKMTAAAATIVAAHARIRDGKDPVAPHDGLGHAANFLYMLNGEEPDPANAKLIDKDMVLHAEHGVNASTFAARVAASTRADIYAAIAAAIAVLKGPKHGGAAEAVMKMAQEVGSEENAESYVNNLLARGERVMGFGHPVYKTVDPRSIHLKEEARLLGERMGQPQWFSILRALTEAPEMKRRARHGTHPNVDFWAGAVYSLLGISEDLFIPLFAIGRMPGWATHVMDQYSKKDLIRPRLQYTGPMDLRYVPIDER
jgi:citrate synthase